MESILFEYRALAQIYEEVRATSVSLIHPSLRPDSMMIFYEALETSPNAACKAHSYDQGIAVE